MNKKTIEKLQQLAALVASLNDGVVGMTLDGVITSWNRGAERMMLYTAEEIIGLPSAVLVPPDRRDSLPRLKELFRRGESSYHYEGAAVRKDGVLVELDVTYSPIKDAAGNIVGVSAIVRDVTERKALERMKNEFISIVSHELRTPLTSLHAALGLLAYDGAGSLPEKDRRMLDIALRNTDRLKRLIDDILTLARTRTGAIVVQKRTCAVDELMLHVTDVMRAMAGAAGVTISPVPVALGIRADPDRVTQVLMNLIHNAIKFSPRGGTIWLHARRRADEVLVRVEDEGRGIPPDMLESIFEPFQQVDPSDTQRYGGTGLGLAICRAIIEQHGGRIWAESIPGRGSVFSFTLPVGHADETSPLAAGAPVRSPGLA